MGLEFLKRSDVIVELLEVIRVDDEDDEDDEDLNLGAEKDCDCERLKPKNFWV